MRPCPLQESAKNRQQTTGMRRGCLSAGRFMMLKNKIKSQRGAAAPQRQACGRARNKSRLYPLCSHHLMYPQQCTIVTPLKSRLYPLCSHHLTYPQQCTIFTPLKPRLYPLCSHHLTYPQQCTIVTALYDASPAHAPVAYTASKSARWPGLLSMHNHY